jgi:hypothetical protein
MSSEKALLLQAELLIAQRSAITGLTFIARRAGIQQAITAVTTNNNATPAKVSGSIALMP